MIPGRRRAWFAVAATIAAAFGARALVPGKQTPARPHRVAILGNEDTPVWRGFRDGLRELGYVDGDQLRLDWRWSHGAPERLPALARELVALAPQVIVVSGTQAALAARDATSSIPIVMALSVQPDKLGLVQSLARPGGNVTGLCTYAPELNAKKLELLKDIAPRIERVALIWNPASPAEAWQVHDVPGVARAAGMTLRLLEASTADQVQRALDDVVSSRDQAMMVVGNPLTFRSRADIAAFALRHRLPSVFEQRLFVDAGGLVSYGPNFTEMFRRAAVYVDRILRGAKPADLPVEQPMRFELIVNRATAAALGLTLPATVLLRSDEVVG
jgi:putative ABC transport system substrate-binding protein